MLFRLCATGMAPHPDYLQSILTCQQVAEWIAYYEIEPFGAQHVELLNGINTAAIFNSSGAKPPAHAEDFMPSYVAPIMTAEEIFGRRR